MACSPLVVEIYWTLDQMHLHKLIMKKDELGEPPEELAQNEVIGKVVLNRGNTFDVQLPESQLGKSQKILGSSESQILVGISPSLRNKFFIKRNGFVVVSLEKLGPNGKINGEITNVVGDVRDWQKYLAEWPPEFAIVQESNTLDLPPISEDEYTSEEEDEEENGEDNGEKN